MSVETGGKDVKSGGKNKDSNTMVNIFIFNTARILAMLTDVF